jgi:hypothetical protein
VDRAGGGRTAGGIQWQIVATESARGQPAPREIRYGQPPPGYKETRPAAILGPGGYHAIALAPGTRGNLQFQVSFDGNVR